MKTLLIAISVLLLATVYSMKAAGQAPASRGLSPQIGYIDAQRVISGSKVGQADIARLQAAQQQRSAELKTSQQALDATRQQLAQAIDGAARQPLQQRAQQQQTDLERATAQVQTDLQTLQREMQTEIQAQVKAAADQVGKDQNLQLILNADNAVVWAAPGMDVTTAVIDRLNAAAAPPAPKH